MCDFFVNSVVLLVSSASMLIATTIMIICDVHLGTALYIGMFMVSSLAVCASITWLVIYKYAYPGSSQHVRRREVSMTAIQPIHIDNTPPSKAEYIVWIPDMSSNIAIGKDNQTIVVITQP